MFYYVASWAFVVFGLSYAVVCALNLLGFARGRLRNGVSERIPNFALAMVGVALAGLFWSPGPPEAAPETWHFYWLGVGAAGLVLLFASRIRCWFSRGARTEGAFFFLRVYTVRSEWRPKHLVVLGAFGTSVVVLSAVPQDGWLFWVTLIPFLALLKSLQILPIHRGRRSPNAPGPEPLT